MHPLPLAALAAAVLLAFPALADPLIVYSGAGLRPAVEPLADAFSAETGAELAIEYAGTGQTLTRFQETARGDVFIAGTRFFTDKLAGQGQIGPVTALGIHGAAIGVAKASADRVKGVADLAAPGLRLALGDPEAMALGRTADEILGKCGDAAAAAANVVARATTLQQLALYVAEGDVDAAILSPAGALPHGDAIQLVEIPTDCYSPEEITAGVLATSTQPELAAKFVAYLASPAGQAAFARAGFGPAMD